MKKALSFFVLLVLISCAEKKTTTASPNSSVDTADKKSVATEKVDMVAEGYVMAVIKASGDNKCPYTIQTKDLTYLLDPTNLEPSYMKDNLNIWLKFQPLRMQPKCDGVIPIEIIKIKLRE